MSDQEAPEEGNIIPKLLAAAARHPDNAAVQAIAGTLRTSVQMAKLAARDHSVLLAGYRMGIDGKEGYGIMHTTDSSGIESMVREVGAMREISGIVIAMLAVMETVGETFDY